MQETEKLFEKDSYLKENKTTVTSCETKDGRTYVTFAKTIFFPEEGGQYADKGTVCFGDKTVRIINGIKDGELIRYEVSGEIPEGCEVNCSLDWEERYSKMQNHSGEHVLSGLICKSFGYDNVGFHLSDDSTVSLAFNGVISYEELLRMEEEANRVIYRNLPITDSYPAKEELEKIQYRSKIEIDGQVRLITIGEGEDIVDICACCAPHVKRTGEIGIIKVVSMINYKGGVKIEILCGERAFKYISKEHELINNLTGILTTAPENILDIVNARLSENNELRSELNRLKEEKILKEISTMEENEPHVIITNEELSPLNMKNIYNALTDRFPGYVALFVRDDEKGYRFYAGSKTEDSTRVADIMRTKLGAKGGGKVDLVQGSVRTSREALLSLCKEIFIS